MKVAYTNGFADIVVNFDYDQVWLIGKDSYHHLFEGTWADVLRFLRLNDYFKHGLTNDRLITARLDAMRAR